MKHVFGIAICLCFISLDRCVAQPTTKPAKVVRVAAIGPINDMGFWDEIVERFEKTTGITVQMISTGNKDNVATLFKQGVVDVLVMQSSDSVIEPVAEDYAMDAQPFLKSDLVIVGPDDDPAGIKGMADASQAVKKIVETRSAFVVHGNSGADVVVRAIVQSAGLQIDPKQVTVLLNDHQRQVLQAAVDRNAYTLIGRVPFKSGKLAAKGFAVMVEGDPCLQRPWLVAVANPAKVHDAHRSEADALAGFLRSADTQRWISAFGKGKLDDRPLFSPLVTLANDALPTTQPTVPMLRVVGNVPHPLFLDATTWRQLPRHRVSVNVRNNAVKYEGVLVRDVLKSAGIPLGDHRMNRPNLSLYVRVEAADGYSAIFSVPEFDDDFADRSILLADQRDGEQLGEKEGPLRLVVPEEKQQARCVRQVLSVSVGRPN